MKKEELNVMNAVLKSKIDEFYSIAADLRKLTMDQLNVLLADRENQKVEFEEGYMPNISYDGGNHPEYASNLYSEVYSVYLKEGQIYFTIEDCDEYEIDRIPTYELIDIMNALYYILSNE